MLLLENTLEGMCRRSLYRKSQINNLQGPVDAYRALMIRCYWTVLSNVSDYILFADKVDGG